MTGTENGYFWHERLDVYRVAIELSAWVQRISPRVPRGRAHLRDQLVRASDSVVLNIAEGAATPDATGQKHYRIALRSVAECDAAAHLLAVAGVRQAGEGRQLAGRVRSMLARMLR